jgi:hypothetical protein
LQVERGIAYFFRHHRGEQFATAKTMENHTPTHRPPRSCRSWRL